MENSSIRITLNKKAFGLRDEIRTWCETNLGEGQWIQKWKQDPDPENFTVQWTMHSWEIDTALSDVTFEFKDPRHATMFLLVWGQYKKG